MWHYLSKTYGVLIPIRAGEDTHRDPICRAISQRNVTTRESEIIILCCAQVLPKTKDSK